MYIVYLGESGNTGASLNDPRQPHLVHSGLVVHENQWVSMNGEFNALYRRHFGGPPGEDGAPKELHAADIYQGRHFFTTWPPPKRAELIQDCLSILVRRETPLIVSFINKREFADAHAQRNSPNAVLWQSPSEPAINRFLFALHMFMDELNMGAMTHEQMPDDSAWPIKDYALVVADASKSVEPKFMADFLKSEVDIPSPAVLENFCFVASEHSVCTQLADLCAYIVRRWLQNPNGSHPYFDALRAGRVLQVMYHVKMQ